MTSPVRALTAGRSYFQQSRAPRYSVLFALPLLLLYEFLAATLSAGRETGGALRNGADVLLRSAFTRAAGDHGPLVFIAAVILLGVWFVARDLRKNRELRLSVFVRMLAESAALAAVFGIVVGVLTAQILGALPLMATAQEGGEVALRRMGWPTRLMLSLGAGLYEELFFRVLLVTAVASGARLLLGLGTRGAGILATLVGAFLFSAFHYVPPYGDPLELASFTFRFIAGVAFSALYLVRGFGITAWTHALYDVYLLLLITR